MTQPAAQQHDGLFRRVVANGEIVHNEWMRVRAEGGFVGTCRTCGDYLIPAAPDEHTGRIDYQADCRSDTCRATLLSPGGRVMRGTTTRSLLPKGT